MDDDGDTILGLTTSSADITFGGSKAVLTFSATVTADNQRWTRRCYDGRLVLTTSGREHYVGKITGFHLLKPSTFEPHRDKRAWIDQWLAGRAASFEAGPAEMMYALRALYKRDGSARPKGVQARGLDHTDDLVFVQKIYILQHDPATGLEFAGKGLLKHALNLFHSCLTTPDTTTLPSSFRMTGAVTLFLEPGLIDDDEESSMWDGLRPKTDNPTEAQLLAFYQSVTAKLEQIYTRPSIGFDVRVRDFEISREHHTVLARGFEAPHHRGSSTASPKTPLTCKAESPSSRAGVADSPTDSSISSSRRSSTKARATPITPGTPGSTSATPPPTRQKRKRKHRIKDTSGENADRQVDTDQHYSDDGDQQNVQVAKRRRRERS